MCWVENFEEVSHNYELFDKVLHELTKPKPRELVANWQLLPRDLVNIVLELLDQYNYQFYTNNFTRIDSIPNYTLENYVCKIQGAIQVNVWTRLIGTPPIPTNKYITDQVVAHKQSLPFNLEYISRELEKRRHKSVDGNIKPSKLKFKYIKSVVKHNYNGALRQKPSPYSRPAYELYPYLNFITTK
jgi:hypothetical protein